MCMFSVCINNNCAINFTLLFLSTHLQDFSMLNMCSTFKVTTVSLHFLIRCQVLHFAFMSLIPLYIVN